MDTAIITPLPPISCKCNNCGSFFDTYKYNQRFCSIRCAAKMQRRKVQRPTHEQLIKEIKKTNFSAVGRKYNVSHVTVRQWCKSYNIDLNMFKKKLKKI